MQCLLVHKHDSYYCTNVSLCLLCLAIITTPQLGCPACWQPQPPSRSSTQTAAPTSPIVVAPAAPSSARAVRNPAGSLGRGPTMEWCPTMACPSCTPVVAVLAAGRWRWRHWKGVENTATSASRPAAAATPSLVQAWAVATLHLYQHCLHTVHLPW